MIHRKRNKINSITVSRQPFTISGFVLCLLWLAFMVVLYLIKQPLKIDFTAIPVIIAVSLIFIIKRIWNWFTLITISPEGILCKTLFKSYRYSWQELKGWGVMRKRHRYPALHLSKEEYENETFFNIDYAWLSPDSDYLPTYLNVASANCISFKYNAKAVKLIESYFLN